MFKAYYSLTKPGIIRGNLITATAGFLLASKGDINYRLIIALLTGVTLVIASGCVFNNYIDREIDAKMSRTKSRALVIGLVSSRSAIIYATVLGLLGFVVLILFTNLLTVIIGFIGLFFYVIVYGIVKRRSVHGTVVGSISGAVPPVAGYCAVTNHFDGGALILFLILAFWQMPHFYAIAMFRAKDYANAKLPVLPIKKSMLAAKQQIVLYVVAFIWAVMAMNLYGYVGATYFLVMAVVGVYWLWLALKGLKTAENERWARNMFHGSLIVLMIFSIMISINNLVP